MRMRFFRSKRCCRSRHQVVFKVWQLLAIVCGILSGEWDALSQSKRIEWVK